MNNFEVYSTTELKDFLNGPDNEINAEQKLALAPIYSLLVEMKDRKFINDTQDIRIFLYNDEFSRDINFPYIETLIQQEIGDELTPDSLVLVNLYNVNEEDDVAAGELIFAGQKLGYQLLNEDKGLFFIRVGTTMANKVCACYFQFAEELDQDTFETATTEILDNIVGYDYYVSYSFKGQNSYMIIRSAELIDDAYKISSVIEQLAQHHECDTNDVFIYGISFLKAAVEEKDVEPEPLDDAFTLEQAINNPFASMNYYIIKYKHNGEIKECETAVGVDLNSKEAKAYKLAESLVKDINKSIKEDDEFEIIDVELAGFGSSGEEE